MRRYSAFMMTGAVGLSLLSGCASQQSIDHSGHEGGRAQSVYKDGIYKGVSNPDERGAVGEITITVQQGKIVQADYKGIQKDGKVKDVDYGKTNGKIENPEFYKKAQQALKGADSYGAKLVAQQEVSKVDAVSGATVSYKQFVEAETKALEQAR